MNLYVPKFVGPKSFLKSRKAWVSLLALILSGSLLYLGALTNDQFTEIFKYVLTLWVGAMSAEKMTKLVSPSVLKALTTHDEKKASVTHDEEK